MGSNLDADNTLTQQAVSARFSAPFLPRRAKSNFSRDEMNLAEFPLTVLSTRIDPKVKTLEFSDHIRAKNGELIERRWIITAADKFGLPTASDDEVLLGLIKLTVDEGMQDRRVHFTRYELLKILRWSTEGRSYVRLQRALDRLSGVRIKATNAFFENDTKAHCTRNFGIIDAYEINDGREPHTRDSFFLWSEALFHSFQVGFIKKLDLDVLLSFESAVSKRMYRFLDKHFWYRSTVQANLFILAHEKIGVSRNYKFASSLKQQLEPALDELIKTGFISDYEYQGRGKGTEIIIRANRKRSSDGSVAVLNGNVVSGSSYQDIAQLLNDRGLKSAQVTRLLSDATDETLARLQKIIEHFDHLVKTKSSLVSRSPIGFLYRAVENPEAFGLPGEKRDSRGAAQQRFEFERTNEGSSGPESRKKAALESGLTKQAEYLVARRHLLDQSIASTEPRVLAAVRSEVETGLSKIRSLISAEKFVQAVDHGVEERVAKMFLLPSFEEWLRGRGRSEKGL